MSDNPTVVVPPGSTTSVAAPKTAEAARAPHVGATAIVPPKPAVPATIAPRPATPQPLTASVNAAVAKTSPLVSRLAARTKSTFDLESPWLRCLIHGEIDSWKSTTAAHFGKPEQTRIILTRGEDQLQPIINEGYKYLKVNDGEEFSEALSHCDAIWPDWAKHPEPVLIVDDLTRAKDFVVSASKTYEKDGKLVEYKDMRKVYGQALSEFDSVFTLANRKPIHIILIATSKVVEGKISLEETVAPDLSQGIGNFVMSDYSYIFFLNKKKPYTTRMLTQMDAEAVTEYDEQQKKTVTYQRYYFARHKIPHELVGKGLIKPYEPADLRAVWERVKAAKGQRKAEGK